MCTVRNGTSLNFLLNDHLGSTSVMLKTNGSLWGELRYSAWGETRYSNGTIVTDRQYTGQINDGDTGLYYSNARYYDPALHRFIQADTIVPDPNDPQTLNRYAYVNNNPIKYTDPTGHCAGEPGDGTDDACWSAWEEVTGLLGFSPLDLWTWDYTRLHQLLTWINKGVAFGQEQNGTAWTSTGLSNALDGLNATEKLMQDSGGTLMDLLGGYLILIASADAYPNDNHARALVRHNLIYFNNGSPSIQLFLHELGHIIDWHLGGKSSFWSNTGLSGWSRTQSGTITPNPNLSSLASYSTASPVEDFADTFTAATLANAGQSLPSGMQLNPTRFDDLKSALTIRFYILEH